MPGAVRTALPDQLMRDRVSLHLSGRAGGSRPGVQRKNFEAQSRGMSRESDFALPFPTVFGRNRPQLSIHFTSDAGNDVRHGFHIRLSGMKVDNAGTK